MRLTKVFFTGLAGIMAGLGGFGLGAYFGFYFSGSYGLAVVEGAALGLCLGAYISALDLLTLRRMGMAARALIVGAVVGALGGGAGLVISEKFFDLIKGGLHGRLAAWALAGALIGASYGIASFSLSKLKRGAAGGAIGGVIGGLLVYLATDLFRLSGAWGKFTGFILLGGSIGYAVGLVEEIMKKSWMVQLSGRGEGQEYSLDRAHLKLGRGSSCHIRIQHDKNVALRHADLRREQDGGFTVNRGEDAPAVLVNKQAVAEKLLEDGDVLQVGKTKLLYREKHTGGRKGKLAALACAAGTAALLLAGAQPAAAQRTIPVDSCEVNVSRVDTGDFPELSVLVTVTDDRGAPVRGLTRENFLLLEDGKEMTDFSVQPVAESGRAACDVVFIFDTTGSMSNEIEGVKRVCRDFAEKLSRSNIDVRLGLVTFGDSIRETYDPVEDAALFKSWVAGLRASGGGDNQENSLAALETGVQLLQLRPDAQKAFVLITDAPPHEASSTRGSTVTTRMVDEAFLGYLLQSGVTVYSIAVDIHQYRVISSRTGGMLFRLQKEEGEFMRLVNTLGSILANQYSFSFRSKRPSLDGTWRGVTVRVVERDRVIGKGDADYMTTGLTGGKLETSFRLPFLALFTLSLIFYLILPGILVNLTPGWGAGALRGAGLLGLSGAMEGRGYPIRRGRMVLGEGAESDLPLIGVGRVMIEQVGSGYGLRCEGGDSAGGVLVNGKPVAGTVALSDGDVVKLGGKKFLFQGAGPRSEETGPRPRDAGSDRLVPLDGTVVAAPFSLSGSHLKVGRSRDNDICIEHSSVSRHHAELFKKKQGYVVRDSDSKNGTFVNDRRITENLLKDGFTVRFGEVSFRVELAAVQPVVPKVPQPVALPSAPAPDKQAPPPASELKCGHCGGELRPGGKFCPGCGKKA